MWGLYVVLSPSLQLSKTTDNSAGTVWGSLLNLCHKDCLRSRFSSVRKKKKERNHLINRVAYFYLPPLPPSLLFVSCVYASLLYIFKLARNNWSCDHRWRRFKERTCHHAHVPCTCTLAHILDVTDFVELHGVVFSSSCWGTAGVVGECPWYFCTFSPVHFAPCEISTQPFSKDMETGTLTANTEASPEASVNSADLNFICVLFLDGELN